MAKKTKAIKEEVIDKDVVTTEATSAAPSEGVISDESISEVSESAEEVLQDAPKEENDSIDENVAIESESSEDVLGDALTDEDISEDNAAHENVVSDTSADENASEETISDENATLEIENKQEDKEVAKDELEDKKSEDEIKEVLTAEIGGSKTLKQTGDKGWYVIHSYAGYEDQVAENLKQRIETLGMKDKIFNVLVPKEKQIEIKNGKRRSVERRIFPGYVMVEMIVTDDSWYVVRNTPNVTGFIGMGVRPTPMLPDEVDRIMKRMGVQEQKYKIELSKDDLVKIVDGPLKGFEGKVTEVDEDKGKVQVTVSMFGRETPVNLDSLQVKKV